MLYDVPAILILGLATVTGRYINSQDRAKAASKVLIETAFKAHSHNNNTPEGEYLQPLLQMVKCKSQYKL